MVFAHRSDFGLGRRMRRLSPRGANLPRWHRRTVRKYASIGSQFHRSIRSHVRQATIAAHTLCIMKKIILSWLVVGAAYMFSGCSGDESGYIVAGTVSGLSASGLVLKDNGDDDITIAVGARSFQFPQQIPAGGSYDVQVAAQPPGLICSVSNGAASNVQGPVTVAVT